MGLFSGSAAITRFRIVSRPPEPDFERLRFTEIKPESEARESIGFLPVEADGPYLVGHERWAFRVRIDRRKPEAVAVRERLQNLIRVELGSTGMQYVGAKKKKELRELAEAELLGVTTPRTKVIECCLDGDVLHVGSTAKAHLGVVLQIVRHIGISADYLTPWLVDGEPEDPTISDFLEAKEPGQSVLGCRCLKFLLQDPEVLLEPESGSARLRTRQAKISLSGEVMGDVFDYLERGAEILVAKLVIGDFQFRFDGMSWRVSGLRFERQRYEHWTEALDARLERINGLFELLDGRYAGLRGRLRTTGFAVPEAVAAALAEAANAAAPPAPEGDEPGPF